MLEPKRVPVGWVPKRVLPVGWVVPNVLEPEPPKVEEPNVPVGAACGGGGPVGLRVVEAMLCNSEGLLGSSSPAVGCKLY